MYPTPVRQRAIALYESGLSCRATADCLNRESSIVVTPQTIARWARELGKNRSVGDRRTIELPKQAVRLYESGLTLEQVAEHFQVSRELVRKRFREMAVRTRPSGLRYRRLADKEWLEGEYRSKGRGAKEIAQGIGCSVLTVHYHIRKHGIARKRKRRTR